MFKQIYEDFLVNENKINQEKRKSNKQKGWFSASSAGSCYKKQWYYINQAEETNSPSIDSLAKMRLGTIVHSEFENAMSYISNKDTGSDYIYYTEHPIKIDDLKVEGTLDMAAHNTVTNQLFVSDLKTIGSYPYKLRFGRDRARNRSKVSTNYELQVCTYAIALSNDLNIPDVFPELLYYNKDTSKIKAVRIPLSYMDEAMQYWEDAADIIDDLGVDFQTVIPNSMIGVPFSDWECNYCNFKDKCYGIV